jgi:hypothetical protein
MACNITPRSNWHRLMDDTDAENCKQRQWQLAVRGRAQEKDSDSFWATIHTSELCHFAICG